MWNATTNPAEATAVSKARIRNQLDALCAFVVDAAYESPDETRKLVAKRITVVRDLEPLR
jgi:hypothetical protein